MWAAVGGAAVALAFAGAAAASPTPGSTHGVASRSQGGLEQFAAERIGQGVLLRWIPVADTQIVGYNVYRRIGAQRVRVNDALIAADPDARGHAYRWLDRTSHHRARYWLEAVLRNGTSTWRGVATAG
jgi:hypothetical protein